MFGVARFLERVAALAPAVFLANAEEAKALNLAANVPAPVTVVKDGPRPVMLLAGGERCCEQVSVVPARVVTDTTGAGDAFAAGFLTSWSRGATPAAAVTAGNALAATVLSRPGAAV